MVNILSFKTELGWISIAEDNKKLISVSFGKQKNKGGSATINIFRNQIISFCLGKIKQFDMNLLLKGTMLQKKIWKELKKIKYGKTKSYGDIAKTLNTSPRYVGNVCGQNNHLLVIPCHRVIRSDGSLGGFSGTGGIKLKQKIIMLEKNE
jgi:methylated-DNA-[protein]-cysteine S-methyltransferase